MFVTLCITKSKLIRLISLLMHAMKKHKLQSSYRSLSTSYHLLDGSVTEGSSHCRTRSEFQLSTENLQQRSVLVMCLIRQPSRKIPPFRLHIHFELQGDLVLLLLISGVFCCTFGIYYAAH